MYWFVNQIIIVMIESKSMTREMHRMGLLKCNYINYDSMAVIYSSTSD